MLLGLFIKKQQQIRSTCTVPSHVNIDKNEQTGVLTKESRFIRSNPLNKIPFSDVISHYRIREEGPNMG